MVRANRRYKEMQDKGIDVTLEDVINNVVGRDYEDTHRDESPLRKAVDAVVLDNTHISQEDQVEFVLNEIQKVKNQAKSSI